MHILNWNDSSIPHELWIEVTPTGITTLKLKVVKDLEPEVLSLNLPSSSETLINNWRGFAEPISTAYDDGYLYSQVRSLFNLEQGTVVWAVNHVKLANGNKMSLDRLELIPSMTSDANQLKPIR